MKIGIDITPIMYGTGVSRYIKELIINLLRIDKKNYYIFFFSSLRNNFSTLDLKLTGENFEIKEFKFPPTFLELLWNRFHCFHIERLIGDIELFHSWDWIQPPSGKKKVTTIHDLSFLHYPQVFPKITINAHKRRLYWVKRECDLVIVDSEATKKDLIKLLNFNEKKIRVIYLGVDEKFKIKDAQLKIKSIKQQYGIKENYILSVGTQEPRKNLKRVIESFYALKDQKKEFKNLKLVLVGKKGWGEEIATIQDRKKDIFFTGFVKDEDLPYLYAAASCFIYPSLYEGFGLPVLEAMAAGCPVITSNISSLPEVAGPAGMLVNPLDIKQIIEAQKSVLQDNPLRQKMITMGRQQAEKFSWEKTARETLRVYEELIKK